MPVDWGFDGFQNNRSFDGWASLMTVVSVHIFNFNQGRFIIDCIESIECSTFRDIELIISDNGSDDDSLYLLRNHNFKFKTQILSYSRNGPLGHRLLRSLSKSTSEYVAIVNADDLFLPSKIERQLKSLKENPDLSFATTEGYRYYEDSRTITYDHSFKVGGGGILRFEDALMQRAHFNPVSFMARRSNLDRELLPFFDLYAEGEDFFLRLLSVQDCLIIKEPLVLMRDHAENMGKNFFKNSLYYEINAIRLKWHAVLRGQAAVLRVERRLERQMLDYAWQTFRYNRDPDKMSYYISYIKSMFRIWSFKNLVKLILIKVFIFRKSS
jgi:glycosyltransferase involved in cell wall biosynthesis